MAIYLRRVLIVFLPLRENVSEHFNVTHLTFHWFLLLVELLRCDTSRFKRTHVLGAGRQAAFQKGRFSLYRLHITETVT